MHCPRDQHFELDSKECGVAYYLQAIKNKNLKLMISIILILSKYIYKAKLN